MNILKLLLIFFLVQLADQPNQVEIKGMYGSPQKLWDIGYTLPSLGVNSIFLHSESISEQLMQRAKKEGVKVFAEFATLNGKGYVEDHPEAWAINDKGEKVAAATWFMGVCPTEPGFRKYRTNALRELIAKYNVDGVWMDYLHWHAQFEDPEPILPETCFCNNCISLFEKHTGVDIRGEDTQKQANYILTNYDSAWRNWRCGIIAGWAKEFKQILKENKPGALLGIYHCPWNDEEFNHARRRILGLDYKMLNQYADVFSPMVYHKRMGREPIWVRQNIEWFSGEVNGAKIWPIVQASNDPGIISPSEFKNVLEYGLSGKSSGVMMFTTDAVANDPGKINVMEKVYKSR